MRRNDSSPAMGGDDLDGSKLRAMRTARGMSLFDLAMESGVTTQAISLIENGNTKNPRVDTLQSLARGLGCDIKDLLDG